MKELLKRLAKLIDVKSIISLATTYAFLRLALKEYLSAEVFISIYSIIIGFYFGTQFQKSKTNKEEEIW